MRQLDNLLNRFTMYQLVFYFLAFLVLLSVLLSFLRILPYDPFVLVTNSGIILAASYISNYIFSKLFRAVTNFESVFITSLILILISPVTYPIPIWVVVLIPILAMGSKYLLAIKKSHIFNPAAFGVAPMGLLFPSFAATWWIGNPILFIPVLLCSFLILKKTRRFSLVFSFLIIYALVTLGVSFFQGSSVVSSVHSIWTSIFESALIFFACIMLTEPSTSPKTRRFQVFYAAIVGILYGSSKLNLLGFSITPELALLVGNIFSFLVSPKYKFKLTLAEKSKLTDNLYSFTFPKPKSFNFKPGQYMEWTLPHKKMDRRGNRRYFSLASSPTEKTIMIAFRQYTPSSSYKNSLIEMNTGEKIAAANLSGDFVLPRKINEPLAFVAGGIGITPFRSMAQFIVDKKIETNIILLFFVKKKEDLVFMNVFERAEKFGLKTILVITDYSKSLDSSVIEKNIPDYKERTFYISGAQPVVQEFNSKLKRIGVKKIKTDYFPGYEK